MCAERVLYMCVCGKSVYNCVWRIGLRMGKIETYYSSVIGENAADPSLWNLFICYFGGMIMVTALLVLGS